MTAGHVYWGALALVALARLGWWLAVAVICARRSSPRGALTTVRSHLAMATKRRIELEKGRKLVWGELPQATQRHRSIIELFRTQRSDALTLGSLGLAVWGVLSSTSADALEPYSLDLLFVGVMLTIVGPVVFRAGGTEGTRMGLETFLSVGYAAIVISLLSFLPTVFEHRWLHVLGFAVALVVVARDLHEVREEISLTRALYAPKQQQQHVPLKRKNLLLGWALLGVMLALGAGTVVVALVYLALD
jgi:hypothetical protein